MAIVTEYQVAKPDKNGIRHWVSFRYDKTLVEKIKKIPSAFRTYDPTSKKWGFSDRGFSLFCAISDVQFLGDLLSPTVEIPYTPRKIDTSLEKVDWDKFKRPRYKGQPSLDLWNFQKVGISQILRNKNHGLFLDMGCGKSYTSVCAAKELLDRKEVKQVLIVSMIGGVLKQWAELLDRMGYSYTLIREEKMIDRPQAYADSKTDFVLTLFTSVLSKGKVNRAKSRKFSQVFRDKAKRGPQMIIVDELHKLGDVTSKTFKEFLMMSKSAKYRVVCTGTIIKSTPDKALLPLRFIAPDIFSNKGVFEEAFMVKEEGPFGSKVVGYKNLNRLKEIIHSYGLVVKKEECLKDLPELLPTKKLVVETSKDSMTVLRSIRGDEKLRLIQNKQDVKYADLKDLYIRIHQAMICPSVFSDKLLAKNMLEAVISILDSVEGKTVIFTTLIAAVNEISAYLNNKGYKNVTCHGGLKDSELDERIKTFVEDNNCNVMIATVQKMGTGFDTLKIAKNCIIYDFNMVAGDMQQAISRLHRSGQKNKVSVFELVQDNVFSEYQREKLSVQENIINQTEDTKIKGEDSIELTNLLKLALESNLFGS